MAGFVYSPLLGAAAAGTTSSAVIHATDWGPTILALAKAASLPHTDGFDVWSCLTNAAHCVRCLGLNRMLHSRMPLVRTPARLTLLHACNQ